METSAFIKTVLTKDQSRDIIVASGKLGPDPSSKHFVKRYKNIAFVLCISGQWFQIHQNFFNQPNEYNDFSGGYRRYYNELPRQFVECEATQRILNEFKKTFNVPEGKLILVQVQTNTISPIDQGKCLTGQGIHSDGADCAMLVCLQRDNIQCARSSVYCDADGDIPVIHPKVLEAGQIMFWKDNQVYHYVEPAVLDNTTKGGSRTVLIAHYPVMYTIQGGTNENNTLPLSGKHPKHVTKKIYN